MDETIEGSIRWEPRSATQIERMVAALSLSFREKVSGRIRRSPTDPPILVVDVAASDDNLPWVLSILVTNREEARRWLQAERKAWRGNWKDRLMYKKIGNRGRDRRRLSGFLNAANHLRGCLIVLTFPPLKEPVIACEGDHQLESAEELFGHLKSTMQLEHRLRIVCAVAALGTCLATSDVTIQLLFDNDEAFEKEEALPTAAIGVEIFEALSTRPMQNVITVLASHFSGGNQFFALTRPLDMPRRREIELDARDLLAIPDLAAGAAFAREVCYLTKGRELGSDKARPIWNWLYTWRWVLQRRCVEVSSDEGVINVAQRECP